MIQTIWHSRVIETITRRSHHLGVFILLLRRKPRVQQIATEGSDGIPSEWWIAPQSSLLFSDDSARLYFDTVPIADDVIEERKGRNSKNSSADKEKKKQSWICGTGKIRSYSRSNYCGPSQRREQDLSSGLCDGIQTSSRSRGERCHRSA